MSDIKPACGAKKVGERWYNLPKKSVLHVC